MKFEEFVDAAGVAVSTVRHYERLGLMPVAQGEQEYSDRDVQRMRFIRIARGARFPLDVIRAFAASFDEGDEPYRLAADLARRRLQDIEREMERLKGDATILRDQLARWESGERARAADLIGLLHVVAESHARTKRA